MIIAIAGSSGFVGNFFKKYFSAKGYEITLINRNDLKNTFQLDSKIAQADVIINLIGANIIQRWTSEYKKILYSSRIENTQKIVNSINNNDKNQLLISTSAVGIYCDNTSNDEYDFTYGNTFLTKICMDWEAQAQKANARVVICRFGVVLGVGGALRKILLPFKFGLGGTIGNGEQPFSYIHIFDLAKAYEFIIENKTCEGVYNLCTPYPTTNKIFTKVLSHILNRPAIFPLPVFIVKLLFGEGSTVLTNGQKVYPKKLIKSGFKFEYEKIEDVLNDLLK
jgi:hypothetical protein